MTRVNHVQYILISMGLGDQWIQSIATYLAYR